MWHLSFKILRPNILVRFINLSNHLRNRAKVNLVMNTAYFRYVSPETDFHVTLRLVIKECGIDKQFNFCRSIDEKCGTFLNRVDANIEKVMSKKKKKKKKKGDDKESELESENKIYTKLLKNDQILDNEFLCKDIFNNPGKYALSILNNKLPIEINAPFIEAITLPKGIMANFVVYSTKFESFFVDKNASTWTWLRSVNMNGPWEKCGDGILYNSVSEDVGKYLKITCKPCNSDGRKGPETEAISPCPVEAGPGVIPCEERHKFTKSVLDNSGIRVVSYNLLADLYVSLEYARTVLFGYCTNYALELPYRRQLFIKEILGYNADIICLQEVDSRVFRHDLENVLPLKGLAGIFSEKGKTGEGTAVYYSTNKLRCIESWSILLADALQNNPVLEEFWKKISDNKAFVERVIERNTTLQVLLLESLVQSNRMLLVVNNHLYFHPDADHIRLFQAALIVTYLESLLKTTKEKFPGKEVSIVWCGDFNSVPECGIYQLLTTGFVPSDHVDWRSNAEETVTDVTCSHHFSLASACGTPEFTNYTVLFKACLDYIFYDTKSFSVEQVVPLPSNDELSLYLAIPSIVMPSDHVALVADLKWK